MKGVDERLPPSFITSPLYGLCFQDDDVSLKRSKSEGHDTNDDDVDDNVNDNDDDDDDADVAGDANAPDEEENYTSSDVDPVIFPGQDDKMIGVGMNEEEAERMKEIYNRYWTSIRTHYVRGKRVQDRYNVTLKSLNAVSFRRLLLVVLIEQKNRFKINISYGLILRHNSTREFRYFHSSQNVGRYLDEPVLIRNKGDMEGFVEKVSVGDVLEWARKQRTNTKWIMEAVTNMTIYVNKINKYTVGVGSMVRLPSFIKRNHYIIGLEKSQQGQTYNGNLCMFRCVAYHKGDCSERNIGMLFNEFNNGATSPSLFQGVSLSELYKVENKFEINIQVYALKQKEHCGNGRRTTTAKLGVVCSDIATQCV